ncbi:NAD-dependent epimerase, partial [Streptomyces sp. NPDC059590]
MSLHVVMGFGPAGAATARLLVEQGHSVRVVTRSGRSPEPGIEHVALDAADTERLIGGGGRAGALHIRCAPRPNRACGGVPPPAAA